MGNIWISLNYVYHTVDNSWLGIEVIFRDYDFMRAMMIGKLN